MAGTFGIPYARCEIDFAGHVVRVCPECGARVREDQDHTGELTTDNYGRHHAEEHGG